MTKRPNVVSHKDYISQGSSSKSYIFQNIITHVIIFRFYCNTTDLFVYNSIDYTIASRYYSKVILFLAPLWWFYINGNYNLFFAADLQTDYIVFDKNDKSGMIIFL